MAAILPLNTPASDQGIYVNGKQWLVFQHIKLDWFDQFGVNVAGASDHLVFANMESDGMVPAGMLPHGFYGNATCDRNLAGRFATRSFTLPRLSRVEDYYVRQYDASSPAKYSRYSTALHLDYPL